MVAPTQQEFVGDPSSPAAARVFATTALASLLQASTPSELCDDIELIVSELVTNAVRAGSPTVQVALSLEGTRVVVRVTDTATGWPEPRDASIHDTGGRGLPLVSALSTSWGVRLAEGGKTVWAELAIANA